MIRVKNNPGSLKKSASLSQVGGAGILARHRKGSMDSLKMPRQFTQLVLPSKAAKVQAYLLLGREKNTPSGQWLCAAAIRCLPHVSYYTHQSSKFVTETCWLERLGKQIRYYRLADGKTPTFPFFG
jgi:hypothetical protein